MLSGFDLPKMIDKFIDSSLPATIPTKRGFNTVTGENFGSLIDFDFEISILSLSTLIGFSLDIISKCVNIFSKPTEPKVSFETYGTSEVRLLIH